MPESEIAGNPLLSPAWVFSFSLAINGFATLMLIFSRSVSDIVILQFVGGIGLGTFWPTAETIVTDLTPIDKRVREMQVWHSFGLGRFDWAVDRNTAVIN